MQTFYLKVYASNMTEDSVSVFNKHLGVIVFDRYPKHLSQVAARCNLYLNLINVILLTQDNLFSLLYATVIGVMPHLARPYIHDGVRDTTCQTLHRCESKLSDF